MSASKFPRLRRGWWSGVLTFVLRVHSRWVVSQPDRGCVRWALLLRVTDSFQISTTTIHRDAPGSLCHRHRWTKDEQNLKTAWPCSFPGRWCAAPLYCPLSLAAHRSGGRWAGGRWAGCQRPERARSVSGGRLLAGGRTGRPAWPAATRSWPRPSADLEPGSAPRHSPPPESQWSYAVGLSWSQSSSGLAMLSHSSCMLFSGRMKRRARRFFYIISFHTNSHGGVAFMALKDNVQSVL